MSMSKDLGSWMWLLRRENPRGFRQRLFATCVCSWVPHALEMVVVLMAGSAALLSANLIEAAGPANMSVGLYSCIGGSFTFFARRDRVLAILADLRAVAQDIEATASAHPDVQAFYGNMMVATVAVPVVLTGGPIQPVWPPPPDETAGLVVGILQLSTSITGCAGFYSAISLTCCLVTTLIGQYGAVGVWLRAARTQEDVQRAIVLHQKVLRMARQVEYLYRDSMIHFMLVCFFTPFISALQLAHNDIHLLTFTGAFLNLAVFLPLAVLSQRLTDASLAVRGDAFHAAFGAEAACGASVDVVWRRRALLMVEVMAGQPAQLSIKGLGVLSHNSAGNALRSWYSFTNVLLKASTEAGT